MHLDFTDSSCHQVITKIRKLATGLIDVNYPGQIVIQPRSGVKDEYVFNPEVSLRFFLVITCSMINVDGSLKLSNTGRTVKVSALSGLLIYIALVCSWGDF